MNVISKRPLREFWGRHPEAEVPLTTWYNTLRKRALADWGELKGAFSGADYAPPYTIFDVGGNKYRVVATVLYGAQRVYVKRVMTHAEYTRWNKEGKPA